MVAVGYLLPTRESVMADSPAVAPMLRLAEKAEALGFDSIWVGDSLLARPRHEPLSLLAAVAARTSAATLGTAVLLPALRQPLILAHLAATVDLISEGRLVLGVGLAADNPAIRAEFAAAGVPFDERVKRMLEGLDLCRELWSGEPVTRAGGFYPVDDAVLLPRPHRPGGPPLWLGGGGPLARRRAALRYDGWFPIGPDVDAFRAGVAEVRSLAAQAGRSAPTVAMYVTVVIEDDSAAAEATLDRFLAGYYRAPASAMRAFQACCAGPADHVAAGLAAWAEAGADHLVIRFAGDHDRHLDAMAALRPQLPS